MTQLALFDAPAAVRPARPATPMLLAMSGDHQLGGAPPAPAARPPAPPLPRTGAELINQSRSCCGGCSAVGHPANYTWYDESQQLLCQRCNAAKLGYAATPNEHGVYLEPTERHVLPRDKKNWQGVATAEIELLDLGPHWIWSTGFNMLSGDCWGSSSPLSDWPPRRAPSKGAALDAAKAYLRGKLGQRDSADARRVMAWLETLGQGGLL